MTTSASPTSHRQAEQRYLATELALLRALLGRTLGDGTDESGDDVESAHRAIEETRATMAVPPAVDRLTEAFVLTPFERQLLLLAAGVEMDVELAAVSGAMRSRPGGARATFALAQTLWPEAAWEALSPSGALRRWHLVELDPGPVVAQSSLRVPERVLQYLVGVETQDSQLEAVLRARGPSVVMAEEHRATAHRLAEAWEPSDRGWPVIQLCGADRDGQEDVAAAVAAEVGWGLSVVLGDDLPSTPEDRWTFATLWTRESLLAGAALYIDGHGSAHAETAAAIADTMAAPVLIGCHEPVRTRRAALWHRVGLPGLHERRELWRAALEPVEPTWNGSVEELAGRLRLSARAIERSARGVRAQLAAGEDPLPLLRHAVAPTDNGLDDLAQRIEPMATWRDLVAPPQLVATLREIASQVRHRTTVYERWGFASRSSRGLGITALFTGESGTGKTMAAEVLANDLSLDLYRIDLSAVVSKYIGETEKNLRRVFDAAEESGAILLFDEADALFGRRSEVKDSHDRYANIEVSYLLQRMEAYRGLAILTTNMKAALDRAFQRRLRFTVQFPFPDARSRERIWRGVFPRQTPVDQLDRKRLAQLSIAGGNIRSIAINAAFRAAAGDGPVTMRHLQEATHGEFAKLERPLTASEGRGW